MDILIQLIGAVGILMSIISFQCKKHSKILLFRTLNEFVFAIQYLLLGAYTGMMMNIIGYVRNCIFTKQIEKGRKTTVFAAAFCILFVIFGIASNQGAKSIIIIVAKVLSTLAYGNKNTTVVRTTILLSSTGWLIYNICVFSVAGVLCEMFTLISLIAGIIRLDIIPMLKNRIHT